MTVFFLLQALDVATTLIGLKVGASEASFFVGRLMKWGPVEALIIAKSFAMLLAFAAIRSKRPRVIVFLNYWFAVIITWNLGTIIYSAQR